VTVVTDILSIEVSLQKAQRKMNEPGIGKQQKDRGAASRIGHLCFLIAKDMRTALDRALSGLNLRAQPAAVLLQICRQRGATPSDLAATVGTDTAGITGLIDHLEKTGLAVRRANPSDRRATIVSPTEKGRSLFPKVSGVFRAHRAQLLAGFTDEELSSLSGLLQRLQSNAAGQLTKGGAD
jgi:DNA-binding MarR family transcriptional regulator